jgi:hypothetical protein
MKTNIDYKLNILIDTWEEIQRWEKYLPLKSHERSLTSDKITKIILLTTNDTISENYKLQTITQYIQYLDNLFEYQQYTYSWEFDKASSIELLITFITNFIKFSSNTNPSIIKCPKIPPFLKNKEQLTNYENKLLGIYSRINKYKKIKSLENKLNVQLTPYYILDNKTDPELNLYINQLSKIINNNK